MVMTVTMNMNRMMVTVMTRCESMKSHDHVRGINQQPVWLSPQGKSSVKDTKLVSLNKIINIQIKFFVCYTISTLEFIFNFSDITSYCYLQITYLNDISITLTASFISKFTLNFKAMFSHKRTQIVVENCLQQKSIAQA